MKRELLNLVLETDGEYNSSLDEIDYTELESTITVIRRYENIIKTEEENKWLGG